MSILDPWMKLLLRVVACFNISAGLFMIFATRFAYRMIGMNKPDINFPLQLVGILVALFGWGYYLVARDPIRNRNLLLIGFWSKALGSVLGTYYILIGRLPWTFFFVYLFADIVYLPPFWAILRRIDRVEARREAENAGDSGR